MYFNLSYIQSFPLSSPPNLAIIGTLIFHAGTKTEGGSFVTNGGRVIAVVCVKPMLNEAVVGAYLGVESVDFEGKYFRKDIGKP